MSWPMSQDFNEAIQNPKIVFSDPDLRDGEPVVGAHGMPLPRSGNFADVYQLRGADGQEWAVKCFTRPVTGLGERYAAISETLAGANFPFSVGFEYLANGIRVGGEWRPVVKMEWIEGLLFNQVVRDNAGRANVLTALGQMWIKLCKRLRDSGVAHADLQHGNVLLVPGSRPGAFGLKLIDYDGMYVPALTNTPSGESGHPSYQHPGRAKNRIYSPDVDRFPHLVVATALKGLAVCGQPLWEKYDNGDNLLFTEDDFRKPSDSKLMRELWQTDDAEVQAFVGRLALSCGRAIPQTPWLDQFAPDGTPAPLDAGLRREVAAAMGISLPVPVTLPPVVAKPQPNAAPERAFEGFEQRPSKSGRIVPISPPDPQTVEVEVDVELVDADEKREKPKKSRKNNKSASSRPTLILGGVALLLVGVAAAVLLSGKKSHSELADNKPDDTKTPDPLVPNPKDKTPDQNTPKAKDKSLDIFQPKPGEKWEAKPSWTADLGANFPHPLVTFSGDSKLVTVLARGKVSALVLDAATGKPATFSIANLYGSPKVMPLDGGKLALPGLGGVGIVVVDPKTGQATNVSGTPVVPKGGEQFVSPDARYVAVGGYSNFTSHPFKLKNLVDGKQILETEWVRGSVYFTADSSRVLVAEWTGRCRWFKLPSGEPDGEFTIPSIDSPAATVTERRVYACSGDGSILIYEGQLPNLPENTIHILDGRSGRILRSVPGRCIPHFGNLSADGSLLTVIKDGGWNNNRRTEIINTATAEVVVEIRTPVNSETLHPTLIPDGSGLVGVLGPSNTLVRYDFSRPGGTIKPKDPKDPIVPVSQPRGVPVIPIELLADPYPKSAGSPSILGWRRKGAELPMVLANTSDKTALIPETKDVRLSPHGVGVHPTAGEFVAVVWKSPVSTSVSIQTKVAHLDRARGNGISWWLEHRSGERAVIFAEGVLDVGRDTQFKAGTPRLAKGDLIMLVVDARENNYFHDTTEIALTITELENGRPGRVWDLSSDVADTITEGNPHPGKQGNKDTWSFVRSGPPSVGGKPKDPYPITGPLDLRVRWTTPLAGGKGINRVLLSSEPDLVFVADGEGVFAPLDGKTGQPRKEFTILTKTGATNVFPLDRGRIATFSAKPDVFRMWDSNGIEAGKIVVPDIPPGSGNAKGLRTTISPDGRFLGIGRAGVPATDNPDVPCRVFDVTTSKYVVTTNWKGGSMFFTADSSRVLVAEWTGRVRWFKLPLGEPDGEFTLGGTTASRRHNFYSMSADGSAIGYNGPAEVKDGAAMAGVLDGKSGKVVQQFPKHFRGSEVALSADGRRAIVLLEVEEKASTFEVVDVPSGKPQGRVRVVGKVIPTLSLSADGRVVVLHDPETDKVHSFDVPGTDQP